MKYVVGARASRLSVAQTSWVVSQLGAAVPGSEFETRAITTRGDTDARPLFAIAQKGIFEKEIDRQVAEGRIDFAVHSMKDVPSDLPPGLSLACVPARAAPDDVIVARGGGGMDSVPGGARVGTSSLRRAVQARRARPDLEIVPIRGNVETRAAHVESGRLDAVILARAGLERLGSGIPFAALDADMFVPSPGQGALALVARSDDDSTVSALASIEDEGARAEAEAERALSESVGSGCRFPVGARALCEGDTISIRAAAFSADAAERIDARASGPRSEARSVGLEAGRILCERGARRLALNWRRAVDEWNRK